jgi:5-methylcytosine-specific restriction endonuclease McrA
LRECVFERDQGICALCGIDTHRLRRKIMRLPFAQRMREIRTLQQSGVIHRRRKSWWEADHITPVVEGGDSNLENMRTLCIPCHREVTRGPRARRLQNRRAIEEPDHAQNPIDLHLAGSDAAGDRVQHEPGNRQA